jgi:HSP20 family molecular chaperone IbpA
MEPNDMWQEMRKHFADMAQTIDNTVRKVPGLGAFAKGRPAVDVYEAATEFIVCAEVPGVPRDKLSVTVKQGVLTIEGREDRAAWEGLKRVVGERGSAEYCRELQLPAEIDPEAQPTAALNDGVLIVRLPKQPGEQAHTIRVEVSGPGE